ncbi:hypothetical protein PSTG_12896 [Puccinia striiformis f. sp. tritici PST-78]|uniref:Uncharacterized protein n=1 Tax=Puccinia striiformis f. sp. tritici PST-78 TaxID=1165861 RepID=A0A0L0V3B8_9BASI|nr:hypothetical protein PSTG_12896 [Puccinia striiformis f. sp. tritici PST-78]
MVGGWLDHQLAPPFVQRWANNGTWPPTLEASEIAHLNVVPILMFWAKRHPTNPHVTQTFAGESQPFVGSVCGHGLVTIGLAVQFPLSPATPNLLSGAHLWVADSRLERPFCLGPDSGQRWTNRGSTLGETVGGTEHPTDLICELRQGWGLVSRWLNQPCSFCRTTSS